MEATVIKYSRSKEDTDSVNKMLADHKREKFYKILDTLPLETIAQVFKAATLVANGVDNHRPEHINFINHHLRQENTKQSVAIVASKLELAAHT